MKKLKLCIVHFVMVAICLLSGCSLIGLVDESVDMTPRKISAQGNMIAEEVVQNVQSAVVGISAHSNTSSSVGSGVAVADGGYILTNHHVVSGARTLVVYLANQTQTTAQYIWGDPSLDLAIIKSKVNLPYLECGTSQDLQVGQDVLAIGTPLTLQFKHTVTKGIVSALNRTLEVGSIADTNYMQNLIQHDASINPGNSGGPLISMDSKLVGINTLKASEAEGIGFAIPIEVGEAVSKRVINNHSFTPAYVGLFGLDTSLAAFHNQTQERKGVFIQQVDLEGPAGLSGIKQGDVLVQVNDNPISSLLDLRVSLYGVEAGERVTFKILRNGRQMVFEVQPNVREM